MFVAQNNNSIQQIQEMYRLPFNKYIDEELYNYNTCLGGSLDSYQLKSAKRRLKQAINPKDIYNRFQFLDVGRFRAVNVRGVNVLLDRQGVFKGHALDFVDAARYYNIDPIYLIAQSAVETQWGTSNFSKGITIDSIADMSAPIYKDNKLVGYKMIKLEEPTKVYNLFGIGAFNASSDFPNKTTILGTTYAYNQGWTTVNKAIMGAAQFLATNYVHGEFGQNTPYKLRYVNGSNKDLWHQYCSDIDYSKTIARIIRDNANLYISKDSFKFIVPTFKYDYVNNSSNSDIRYKSAYVNSYGRYLLFREIPSVNGAVICSIKDGKPVHILMKSGRWYKVKYNNRIGWLRAEYVRV